MPDGVIMSREYFGITRN